MRFEFLEPLEVVSIEGRNAIEGLCGRETQFAFHFSAADSRADQVAERRFDGAQFIADTKLKIKVARIDAFNLKIYDAESGIPDSSGISCHAVNRSGSRQ